VTPDELLTAAAEMVGAATHPIAAAIRREAERRELKPGEAAERRGLPGLGVEAGARLCGSAALLAQRGVTLDLELVRAADGLAARGHSLAFVADAGRCLGALALADGVRPDARDAVRRLREAGISVALVSGDHQAAVALAAGEAGIDELAFAQSPEAKLARVRRERERGARVAFAGDGINDAAALAASELGFAFAQGSDVTLLAADVVSHSPRLTALPLALALSRTAMRRIRENLGLAVAYNAVAVPLAILGVIGPFSAALAMSASSLLVTGNALRLRRFGSHS
jgi:P-type E1-E2 ATPase